MTITALGEIDRRFTLHPFTALRDHEAAGPLTVIAQGHGSTLVDDRGRRFLDAMAGLWCVNVGYGRAEIAEAVRQQTERLSYCHAFSSLGSEQPALLAQRLVGMAPGGMVRAFFGNSGSDANDTQVKIAWYYNNALGRPAKKKVLARQRGYHGVTIATAGLTGLPGLHGGFDLPLPFVRHVMAPSRLWAGHGLSDAEFAAKLIADTEQTIAREGADTIAAMIVEPVMGAGGVLVPPPGYYAQLTELLRAHDILLIADEVICGFGRLGEMFGSDVFGLKPDLMTVAKGLTSAYFPLSACIVSDPVWQVLADGSRQHGVFGHGYTYSSHPVGAAAAMANLDILEREALVARNRDTGALLHRLLRDAFANHSMVGEIRGLALIGAVEFVRRADPPEAFDPSLKVAARIVRAAFDRGVIGRALPAGDSIAFSPPFTTSEPELASMVSAFRDAADQVMGELRAAGQF